MASTQSLGYIGNGVKFTAIETLRVSSCSGGTADLILDGNAQSVIIQSAEAVADAIQLTTSDAAGGVTYAAGTGGINLVTTGQTVISGSTFAGAAITGDITITAAQSGTTFSISPPSALATILLPTTAAGLHYRFVFIAPTAGFNVVVTATGDHMFGTRSDNTTLSNKIAISAATTITWDDDSAAAANIGDSLELWGIDATHWYANLTLISAADADVVIV